ncbi:hypothetical protein [Micromonospora sp. CA-246542]|uniref:hypothetical protein n=1 Tax=Micromonospora sp. CA-246542 TaxID=3239959 RepID=UPI003D94081B
MLRHAVAAAGVLCIAGLAALVAASATRYVWIIWLVFAVLLLGVFWGIGDAWRFSRRRYYLCEGGLLVAAGVTRLTRTLAWDQVAELWRYQTRVYSEDGPQSFHRCRMRLRRRHPSQPREAAARGRRSAEPDDRGTRDGRHAARRSRRAGGRRAR